jgi:hypothetical protein
MKQLSQRLKRLLFVGPSLRFLSSMLTSLSLSYWQRNFPLYGRYSVTLAFSQLFHLHSEYHESLRRPLLLLPFDNKVLLVMPL